MAEVIGGNHIMAPLPERMTPRQSAPLARELARQIAGKDRLQMFDPPRRREHHAFLRRR